MTVVGLHADGSPAPGATGVLASASVVVGGARHLDLVRSLGLPADAELVRLPSPLRDGLPGLLERFAGRSVVVLASGDPTVSGIATTLVDLLGPDAVRTLPAVSSVALARARMGWSAEESVVVTLVGRHESRMLRELAPGRRLLLLTSGSGTPAVVADLLVATGYADATVTLLSDLGSTAEGRETRPAREWVDATDCPPLHVLAVDAGPGPAAPRSAWVAGLPDEAFESDGQLTRRDLRASALARLAPRPGEHLWDVGAGAGSVGIEWMRAHPTCRTTAVEADPVRAERVRRNAAALGVPDLVAVEGRAPEDLEGLPSPDAVFIGGGATRPGVLDACLAALRPGGRIVVHGVTLETEALLARTYAEHGGELTRLSVEAIAPVGTFTGWTPARTVTQWCWWVGSGSRRGDEQSTDDQHHR